MRGEAAAQGAGVGGGRTASIALNRLITQEESPEGVLCQVAEELGNLNDVNVATAFSKLSNLCSSRSFPRNVAADDRFRELTVSARAMCANGRLQAQAVANITHAVGKMSAAGKLAADDADVQTRWRRWKGGWCSWLRTRTSRPCRTKSGRSRRSGGSRGLRRGRRWRLRWCGWLKT